MIPEVAAYLDTVGQEIKAKEIKEVLISELYQHLEDSACQQIENGMDEETAWQYALLSMGDAKEIGRELNRVHRKQNPILPLSFAGASLLIAVFMSTPLLAYRGMLQKNLLCRLLACLIILALTYFGNFLIRKPKLLFTAFAAVWGVYALCHGITLIGEAFLSDKDILLPFYIFLRHSNTFLFAFSLQNILLLAHLEAKRSYSARFYSILAYIGIMLLTNAILNTYSLTAACILTASFAGVILCSRHNSRKQKLFKLGSILCFFCIVQLPNLQRQLADYTRALAYAPYNDNLLISSLLREARPIGRALLSADVSAAMPKYFYTDYHIAYWCLTYGIVPACLLLCLAGGLYFTLYRAVQNIRTCTCRMLATGCLLCLCLQFILYVMGNFGFSFFDFPSLPLLSEGISSSVANAVLLGSILTLYRHDRVIVTE